MDGAAAGAGPGGPPSALWPGLPYSAGPKSEGTGARARAVRASPSGTSGSGRPGHPAPGRAVRTSYLAAVARRCCWHRCIPSRQFSAWPRWQEGAAGLGVGKCWGRGSTSPSPSLCSFPLLLSQPLQFLRAASSGCPLSYAALIILPALQLSLC